MAKDLDANAAPFGMTDWKVEVSVSASAKDESKTKRKLDNDSKGGDEPKSKK